MKTACSSNIMLANNSCHIDVGNHKHFYFS